MNHTFNDILSHQKKRESIKKRQFSLRKLSRAIEKKRNEIYVSERKRSSIKSAKKQESVTKVRFTCVVGTKKKKKRPI